MQTGKLNEITGKTIKEWYEWLKDNQEGCCSFVFETNDRHRYCVCMGWHNLGDGPKEKNYNHWVIAWKIGRQTHNNVMQTDLDIDFEMPYDEETGDVDDTEQVIEFPETATMKEWNSLATEMRKTARRVWKDWG